MQGKTGALLVATVWFLCTGVGASAHDPQPQQPSPSEPSAQSLLNSTAPNGRVGGYSYNGSLKPTPSSGSRFSNNAVYGSAGNIVGVDHNGSASRFQSPGAERFRSSMDFNILRYNTELRNLRAEQNRDAARRNEKFDSGVPRLVTAREPQAFPYATSRRPNYGKRPGEAIVPQESLPTQGSIAADDSSMLQGGAPQLLWMRGRAPLPIEAFTGDSRYGVGNSWGNVYSENPYYDESYSSYAAASALGGGLNGFADMTSSGNAISLPPINYPTLGESRRQFQEYLETALLRSPDVNLLSPVQVTFVDGVVTVRGVVPDAAARVAAGRILLSDPRVVRVNNLMTCLQNDDGATRQETEAAPNGQ